MPRIYKTAAGKTIDLEKLALRNEETIAVGNMRVNARGDELGPGGKVVKGRNQRVQETYDIHGPIAKNTPTMTSNKAAKQQYQPETVTSKDVVADKITEVNSKKPVDSVVSDSSTKKPRGGLAAAVARSKTSVATEEVSSKKTVKRIQNGGE